MLFLAISTITAEGSFFTSVLVISSPICIVILVVLQYQYKLVKYSFRALIFLFIYGTINVKHSGEWRLFFPDGTWVKSDERGR